MTPPTYVTHIESPLDHTRFSASMLQTTHQGRPLWVGYDLRGIRRAVDRRLLARRAPDMWRYSELLPTAKHIVSLGEVMTPLVPCPRLGARIGVPKLLIKDESRMPTGSFKARGMAVAMTMARHFGIKRVALPSDGNAGGAAAAYAARADIECHVFMPRDAPEVNRCEAALFGAQVTLVDGDLADCRRIVKEGTARMGWFDLSTLREPYRLEGKKTMGLELAEQLGWNLPDVVVFPTGGGTGLIGIWKACQELLHLGWVPPKRLPRFFACQIAGCAPLAAAFLSGKRFADPVPVPASKAAGLRVPSAIGDFMVLDAVRASGGQVATAREENIKGRMAEAASLEGISLCPESAAGLDVLANAAEYGEVSPDETVVLFNTAAAQKYVETLRLDLPLVGAAGPDWDRIKA